jgi:hypothetical protein
VQRAFPSSPAYVVDLPDIPSWDYNAKADEKTSPFGFVLGFSMVD